MIFTGWRSIKERPTDFKELLKALSESVIVGTGFIGMEVAS